MNKLVTTLVASMLLVPAVSSAAGLSYTYVQGGYTSIQTDQSGVDADGFYAGGSFLVAPNVFIAGSYSESESDDFGSVSGSSNVESTSYNVGAGFRAAITDYLDFNFAGAYIKAEADLNTPVGTASSDEDGYGLSTGLRTLLGEHLEVNVGYNYTDVVDEESSFDVGGLIHLGMFSITAGYRFGDSADAWTAGGRFNF